MLFQSIGVNDPGHAFYLGRELEKLLGREIGQKYMQERPLTGAICQTMIYEVIASTLNADGSPNWAPMGLKESEGRYFVPL